MNDNRTDAEKYKAWLDAVNKCAPMGWRCVSGWVFLSPRGTLHDLSAADLKQLKRIESDGLFIANAGVEGRKHAQKGEV